jgi:hypothetical protein
MKKVSVSNPELHLFSRTLDALGLALADVKHKWSREERALYEKATKTLSKALQK